MPRGSGKTTLCVRAIEWAIRHGHRSFPFLVTAEQDAFVRHLAGIKVTFETKQILLDDFPELCHPIRCVNRSPQSARGQTCHGELARVSRNALASGSRGAGGTGS